MLRCISVRYKGHVFENRTHPDSPKMCLTLKKMTAKPHRILEAMLFSS